ncbi:MAG: YncE family protein [Armatimonadetes bacterium]|nr:YncE family protein [Armatimonadota bacterium]
MLNLADNSLVANVPLGTRGFGVAVHPKGHRFYVALPNVNQLAIVDAMPPFSFSTVGVGVTPQSVTPQSVAVSPDGKRVYIGNYGDPDPSVNNPGSVTILDENGGFVQTVTVGTNPYGVQVSPDSSRVFVANWGSNNLSVIDAVSFEVSTVALSGRAPVAFGISMLPEEVMTVGVDIMPGGNPNMINLRAQGTLPVAILGSAEFNVATIDPTTVTLAGAGVVMKKNGPMASMDDVNGDGFVDLVVHVARKDLKLQVGDTEAVLEGKTYDGLAIRGTDSVVVIH